MPCFQVDGLPPNKAGGSGNSMWRDDEQARRLIALRRKALGALGAPFSGDVRLTLKVHVRIPDWGTHETAKRYEALKSIGDLDNLIGGVCDGLMGLGKHPNTEQKLASAFCDAENEAVHPRKKIGYEDDSQISEIRATRVDHAADSWYQVELEEVDP